MAGGRRGVVPTESSGLPRIDMAVLGELLADVGGDAVAEVCGLFVDEAREQVEAMRSACASGDAGSAVRSAHRLKSASGFVGAGGLSTLCREIERLSLDGRLDEAASRVELLSDELEEVSRELASAIARPPRPDGSRTGRRGHLMEQ